MNVSEARQRFRETLHRVYHDEEHVILGKNGIPVAAIVPISTVRDAADPITEQHRSAALDAFRRLQDTFVDVSEDELERSRLRKRRISSSQNVDEVGPRLHQSQAVLRTRRTILFSARR